MAKAALRQIILGLAATGLVSACVEGGGSSTGGATAGLVAGPARGGGTQDVEAPEVFQVTDSALWDGRPSLGGIWVASPDVVDPERVIMFNPATGKSVNGALFRRERDNPGPTLQLSSDAAEALGILAGQPTQIQVTALRRVEAEAPAEVEPLAESDVAADTDEAASEGAADPAATDPAATEAAAIAAAALDATGTTVEVAADAADGATAAVTEPPKRKTWKERRAEAKAKREAEKAAKAAAEAAAAGLSVPEGDPTATAPTAESVDVGTIETAPLDARTPEAAPANDAPPAQAVAAAPVEPAPAASGASRPIQIASFSKQENAQRAVDALAKIGITAQPQKSERGGKAVWGVVAVGDAALLAKIKDAGFADAYFLQ
jgi:hypothetical protein